MRAIVVDPSAVGHLAIRELDPPSPAPNELTVRVSATSLNLGEVRYAQSMDPGERIGWDFAGTVEREAADGSGPNSGTRVVGMIRQGAWSELVATPAAMVAPIPDNVSFAQAATLPVAGLTALYVLECAVGGLLGRNVLVTGANGGVGMFALQLAKIMGGRAVGVIRREQYVEMVRSWGAEEVVVSEDASKACDLGPYHLIAESVGGAALANCMAMLGPDGVCVSYGSSAGSTVTFEIWPFIHAQRPMLYGFLLFNEFARKPASDGLARLGALVAKGRLKIDITKEDRWENIGQLAQDLFDRKIPAKAVAHIG